MKKGLLAFIVASALVQFNLCMPTEPVPSIETITNEELASMEADQLTALILENIVHDVDKKAPDFEIVLKQLIEDMDKLIADTPTDDEKSMFYLDVRHKIEDFLQTIQEDMATCGLYSLVVSVSNQITSYLLFRDRQLYYNVWHKYFNGESELFDFESHMKNIATTAGKMEKLFEGNEKLHKEVSKKVIAEVRKCKQVDILGMFFLVQNVSNM